MGTMHAYKFKTKKSESSFKSAHYSKSPFFGQKIHFDEKKKFFLVKLLIFKIKNWEKIR